LLLALVGVIWAVLGDGPAVLGPGVVDGVVEVILNDEVEWQEDVR
jgi:hypothetical protein